MSVKAMPSWAAPLVGAAVGVVLGLKAGARAPGSAELNPLYVAAGGGAIGALAGCILWLIDAQRRPTQRTLPSNIARTIPRAVPRPQMVRTATGPTTTLQAPRTMPPPLPIPVPRPTSALPREFFGKMWINAVTAGILGSLSLFALIMGPLFLTDAIESANGRPGAEAGIPLTLMGLFMALPAVAGVVQLIHKRRPVLRICREGIECRLIGRGILSGIGGLPVRLRAILALVCGDAFRVQTVRLPWQELQVLNIVGSPLSRLLLLGARGSMPGDGRSVIAAEAEFAQPLEVIVQSIRTFGPAAMRTSLPSWD